MKSQNQQWEVQKILQRGVLKNVTHYFVLWKGFPLEEATWEPITNLQNCQQAILEFQKSLNEAVKPSLGKKTKKRALNLQNVFKRPQINQPGHLKNQPSNKADEIIRENQDIHLGFQAQISKIKPQQRTNDIEPNEGNILNQQEQLLIKFSLNNQKNILQDVKSPEKNLDMQERILSSLLQNQNIYNNKINENDHQKIKKINFERFSSQQQSLITTKFDKIKKTINKDFAENQDCVGVGQNIQKKLITNQSSNQLQDKHCLHLSQNLMVNNHKQDNKIQRNEPILQVQKSKWRSLISHKTNRYELCDQQYQYQQKNSLLNVLNKISGKDRQKRRLNLIDITKQLESLKIFQNIRVQGQEHPLVSLDVLIKIEYGWVAIGRTIENRHIMIDVNLIKQENWKVLIKFFNQNTRS